MVWDNCYGTLTLPDGSKHVGEFKDDKLNGQGTLLFDRWAQIRRRIQIAIPRSLFADILRLIAELRPSPITSTA